MISTLSTVSALNPLGKSTLLAGLACLFLSACASTALDTGLDIQSHNNPVADASSSRSGDDPLRVMTLNMAHARGTGINQMLQSSETARQNLESIAVLLKQQSADVVSLQEVDYQSSWNGNFDHVSFLAEKANFRHSVSGSHVKSMGLDYGTALVANLDMGDPVSTIFTTSEISSPKGFVVSSISWPDKACIEVDVVSAHLDFASEQTRREQASEIIASLKQRNRPIILMGDFNTGWKRSTSAVRILAEALNLHSYAPDDSSLVTFPKHTRRLDWILVSDEINFDSYQVIQTVVSDHLGIVSDMSINRDCG